MARQEENYHAQAQAVAWEYLIGYSVEDEKGEKIGTVKALWEDFTRQPAYLGIATSWLDMGRIHVVPAHYATVSERKQCIRLPFAADIVKNAPECHAADEITLRGETKIRDYFRRQGVPTDFGSEPGKAQKHGDRISSEPKEHGRAEPDWSPQAREQEEERRRLRREPEETLEEEPEMNDSRSLRERISDAVERGKSEFKKDRDDREEDRPSSLRKVYHDQPVAEPVLPREENREYSESIRREKDEDSFVPLRKEAMDAERRRLRREEDRDDLPLR